jgi:hypothetical protein
LLHTAEIAKRAPRRAVVFTRKAVSGPPPFRLVTAAITRDYPHLLAALGQMD